jgi:hypothetical protein
MLAEAVFHVALGHAIVSFVDLLDRDDFDVCSDVGLVECPQLLCD